MKRKLKKLISKSIVLSLIFGCWLTFPNVLSAQPKIEFTETSYDLGEMYQNMQKSHVFELKNTGTEKLTIDNVKGG